MCLLACSLRPGWRAGRPARHPFVPGASLWVAGPAVAQWPAASAALRRALIVNSATRAPAATMMAPASRPAT